MTTKNIKQSVWECMKTKKERKGMGKEHKKWGKKVKKGKK